MKSSVAQSKTLSSGDYYRMLAPFLSAYDPSDLPGGSIDPLGFERGYLFLADKILPGLTNAAGRPRYLSVVCAGALLAPPATGNERENIRIRADRVLRLERFWAVANVLASERSHDLPVSGIRGVTFAQDHIKLLKRSQRTINRRQLQNVGRPGAVRCHWHLRQCRWLYPATGPSRHDANARFRFTSR